MTPARAALLLAAGLAAPSAAEVDAGVELTYGSEGEYQAAFDAYVPLGAGLELEPEGSLYRPAHGGATHATGALALALERAGWLASAGAGGTPEADGYRSWFLGASAGRRFAAWEARLQATRTEHRDERLAAAGGSAALEQWEWAATLQHESPALGGFTLRGTVSVYDGDASRAQVVPGRYGAARTGGAAELLAASPQDHATTSETLLRGPQRSAVLLRWELPVRGAWAPFVEAERRRYAGRSDGAWVFSAGGEVRSGVYSAGLSYRTFDPPAHHRTHHARLELRRRFS